MQQLDLKQVKVEEIKTTGSGGKSVQFSGTWSGNWNGNCLFTGKGLNNTVIPFPDTMVVGATVDCMVKELKSRSGGEWWALEFPDKEEPTAQQSGSSWRGGGRQDDTELKIVSFAMRYATDMYNATADSTVKGLCDIADQLADHMVKMHNRIKG